MGKEIERDHWKQLQKICPNENFNFEKRYEETKWFENHGLKYNLKI
jgi:hypothetical protein